jgi:type II secretion system protein H
MEMIAVCQKRLAGTLAPPQLRRAFTLIEMMVVVVIIGITTALIIPEMKGTFEDALLRSTGRDLVEAFSLAASRAVSFNQPHRVELNPRTGEFSVESRARDEARGEFAPLKDVAHSAGKLDARIAIEITKPAEISAEDSAPVGAPETDSSDAISFYPDGTADAAEIRLRDRAGFQLRLRVNPITARVQITEPEHE